MTMTDAERKAKIDGYIDGWMEQLNARTREYVGGGMALEQAVNRATFDIRMAIRRAPPVKLDD